jgi:hypothetical protein
MHSRLSAALHATTLTLVMSISPTAYAFSSLDETQNPNVLVPEVCTLTTTTPAAITQTKLETGVIDDATLFGIVTGTCNSASGFKYQIKADGDTCEFKHASLDNAVAYTINLTTPASGPTVGAVTAISDACPDDSTGFVTVWTVTAGNVHIAETLSLQTSVTGSGEDTLPDGTYDETMVVRLADI